MSGTSVMQSSSSFDRRLIEAAVAEAVSGARWERIDLETRRPDCTHSDLMLAKAAELAMSPVARDQLMSLALERVGQGQQTDAPLIGEADAAGDRARIASRVFALGPPQGGGHRSPGAGARGASCGPSASGCLFGSAGAVSAAGRGPAGSPCGIIRKSRAGIVVRLTMLCSIPKLRARAEDLSSASLTWWGRCSAAGSHPLPDETLYERAP